MLRTVRKLSQRLATSALFAVALFAASRLPAAEPALPSDAEIAQFLAVESALVADPSRAGEVCELIQEHEEAEESTVDSFAEVGPRLEANPIVGPLLRRHGIAGQRFAEVGIQVTAGLIGLAIADSTDQASGGQAGARPNRTALLRDSAVARVVAPHEAKIAEVLSKVDAFCPDNESDAESEDEAEYE